MKPTVIYIVGLGRSGSTLLADILGSLPGFVAVGELPTIWRHGWRDNWTCSDGLAFADSPVWQGVLARMAQLDPDFSPNAALHLSNRAWARRHLLPWSCKVSSASLPADMTAYGAGFHRLYDSIAAQTGARVIVDSGKIPFHAALMRRVPGLDFRVIHLVRDPRAVAFSRQRHRRNLNASSDTAWMKRQTAGTVAARWIWHNLLARLCAEDGQAPVSYDALAADPAGTIRHILRQLDLSVDDAALAGLEDRRYLRRPGIAFTGNPSRFTLGWTAIQPDTAWRSESRASTRALVGAVTWPLRLKLGT